MTNAACGGGARDLRSGGQDHSEHTVPAPEFQAAARALTLAWHHEWPAEALGTALALRLDRPRRLLLAIGGLMALDAETRERLAEAALGDMRAGPPIPPFAIVKAEAELWASYASPAERKHYIVAAWNALPEHDRVAFLRRAA